MLALLLPIDPSEITAICTAEQVKEYAKACELWKRKYEVNMLGDKYEFKILEYVLTPEEEELFRDGIEHEQYSLTYNGEFIEFANSNTGDMITIEDASIQDLFFCLSIMKVQTPVEGAYASADSP